MMLWKKTPGMKTHTVCGKNDFDFGFALGRAVKTEVQTIINLAGKLTRFQELKKTSIIQHAIEFLKEDYLSLFQELDGLRTGVQADLEAIVALNFFEDYIWEGAEHCSLIVRNNRRRALIGWNEDGNERYLGKLSLIYGRVGGQEFLTLNYPGLLCGETLSITSRGLVLALQGLLPFVSHPFQAGAFEYKALPRALAGRLFLNCRGLEEVLILAQKLTQNRQLGQGFHLFAYETGLDEMVSLEFHPLHSKPFELRLKNPSFFAHTNHYLLAKEAKEQEGRSFQRVSVSSLGRLAHLNLFQKEHLSPEELAEILSDSPPAGFCFSGEKIFRTGSTATLGSQVLEIMKNGLITLWTSPGLSTVSPFTDWAERKVEF